jgi:uncharacterized protein with NAD-binding domain and iron-sulfur cluster
MDFTVTPGVELVDARRCGREGTIIGGGVGAMTTAFYLTDQPGWQNRYGSRLPGRRIGGKARAGATRPPASASRSTGLHIWFVYERLR